MARWSNLRAQQLVGVVIGLGVVVLAGLVARRYFDARVGIWAAVIAALYPGFWVIEAQILSEPLCLLLLGIFFLECAALSKRPTVRLSVLLGATCGVLALVRSEQILLLLIVVVPLLVPGTVVDARPTHRPCRGRGRRGRRDHSALGPLQHNSIRRARRSVDQRRRDASRRQLRALHIPR